MKKTKTIYWILTGLFSILMILTSIPNVIMAPDAINFISGQLGYPQYFIPFIGVVKILGVIAILLPGFPRVKEWAYFGLIFDLISAFYSILAIGSPVTGTLPILLFIALGISSYIYYHKKEKAVKTAQ